MKLVLATPLYPPEIGGPATYAKALVEGLPARGIDVELVKFSDVRHLPRFLRHYVYFRKVVRAAKRADIVLALDPVSTGFPAMRAAKRAGKPFIVKIVGDYAWEQGRQRFGITEDLDEFVQNENVPTRVMMLRKIQTRVAAAATRVIVPSEYLKKIITAWGIPAEKIEVIYNAVPLEALGNVPAAVSRLPRPLVVSAGRLVPWKNFEGVIDAASAIGASLAIVGDGPDRAKLEALAREKLGNKCVFTGALSHGDALAVIKSGDVFALNSSYEGLAHSLIEAQMLGVPVVATEAGGNREVIGDGSGTLVPIGDAPALARALVERKAPIAGIASRFGEEKMLAATAMLLESLI